MPSALKSRVGVGLVLVAALAVAACYPRFQAVPTGSEADKAAVAGDWQSQDGEDPRITMSVAAAESRGAVLITIRDTDDPPADDDLVLGGVVLKIGDGTYAVLRDAKDPGDAGVMLFRYEHAGDALTVTPISDTKVIKAIKSGALPGTVQGEGQGAEITVTASADALAAFLTGPGGKAAFEGPEENKLHFKRTRAAADSAAPEGAGKRGE